MAPTRCTVSPTSKTPSRLSAAAGSPATAGRSPAVTVAESPSRPRRHPRVRPAECQPAPSWSPARRAGNRGLHGARWQPALMAQQAKRFQRNHRKDARHEVEDDAAQKAASIAVNMAALSLTELADAQRHLSPPPALFRYGYPGFCRYSSAEYCRWGNHIRGAVRQRFAFYLHQRFIFGGHFGTDRQLRRICHDTPA